MLLKLLVVVSGLREGPSILLELLDMNELLLTPLKLPVANELFEGLLILLKLLDVSELLERLLIEELSTISILTFVWGL